MRQILGQVGWVGWGFDDDQKGGSFYLYKTHIPVGKLDNKPLHRC